MKAISRDQLSGKVQTVLGLVAPDDLGITLPHEHFVLDARVYYQEPELAIDKALARQPISLENLNWVRHHQTNSIDNLILDDEQEAIEEVMLFKQEGGRTVVDCSNRDHKRDPEVLVRISQATGLNIIMGSGYYVWPAHDAGMNAKTEDAILQEFIQDITEGVDGTGVRSGVIGELGTSSPLHPNELKVLNAGARAQQITGAPISIHSPRHEADPLKVVKILTDAGADPHHVIMCDVDRTLLTHERRCELARTGCYLEYDHFGQLDYYFMPEIDMPNDRYRINEIIQLIESGYLKQILLSQDVCFKTMRCRYGGHGYAHILKYVVPVMRMKGVTEEQIHTLLVENPKRALTFI
jgi:phosphotriesterase-related protein